MKMRKTFFAALYNGMGTYMLSAIALLCLAGCSHTTSHKKELLTMLAGTYTDGGSHGIYSFRFNQDTGESEL